MAGPMSQLAALLDAQAEDLLRLWIEALARGIAPEGTSESGLRDHIPAFLRELRDALRGGQVPAFVATAREHGLQRDALRFDLDALVREYGLLRSIILDAVEAEGFALTLAEVRILTDFVTLATAEGVSAYMRHQEALRRAHETEAFGRDLREREHAQAERDAVLAGEQAARAAAQFERERLHALFMQSPVAIAILEGPEHRFSLANAAYRTLVNNRDVVGKSLLEALPDVRDQGFDKLLDQVMTTGETFFGKEVPITFEHHAAGETLVLNFVYTPKRDASGVIDGVLVSGVDVTETVQSRRRVEALAEGLRAQQSFMQSVVDAMPLLISFVSADERYLLVNKAYESWFGIPREAMIGRTVLEVIGEAAYATLVPFIRRGLASERFDFEQYGVAYRHGGTRDVKVSFIPRHDTAGFVTGYVALLEDITERRALEAERERLFDGERAARAEADTQREHLRTLVETAPLGIATWRGPEHVFEYANDLYVDAFRLGDAVLGRRFADVFAALPPGHPLFATYDEVYRTGRPFTDPEYHVAIPPKGGSNPNVYVFHLTPVRDPEGRIDGLMACLSDVTEVVRFRKMVEVERDVANAIAAMETSSRQASDEARGRTEFLLAVAASLGQSLDLDVILQRLVEIVAPARASVAAVWSAAPGRLRRRVHAPFSPVLVDPEKGNDSASLGRATALPVERVWASGKTLLVADYETWMAAQGEAEAGRVIAALGIRSALFVPIYGASGVVAVLTAGRAAGAAFSDADVAVFESVARLAALAFENARLFAETERLRKTAEEATEAKDRFLAHVSHDLRNPLNSILGWSSLMRSMTDDPAQMARGLDVIERNAKSQVQLIEDLLDVSRITAGKLSLEIEVQDVRAAVDTALDAAKLAAAAKGITLEVFVDADVGAVTVDPDRFRQIVWNLVANAVKFTPRGGLIRVSGARVSSKLRLVVTDTGRGISREFLPRIFGAFEQAEADSQRSGGLGLGLAIVRHLVELHGGSIKVESEGENKGARFTVELPIRAAVRSSTAPATADGPRPLDALRVLVVDDGEDAREVVTAILEHAGAIVTTAASVDEALAAFLRNRPDAIVSDIGMPTKDGKAFVREVRALPEAQGGRTPAIALTALSHAKDRAEILSSGFDAHVAKPVEPAELVLVIAGVLERDAPRAS